MFYFIQMVIVWMQNHGRFLQTFFYKVLVKNIQFSKKYWNYWNPRNAWTDLAEDQYSVLQMKSLSWTVTNKLSFVKYEMV